MDLLAMTWLLTLMTLRPAPDATGVTTLLVAATWAGCCGAVALASVLADCVAAGEAVWVIASLALSACDAAMVGALLIHSLL